MHRSPTIRPTMTKAQQHQQTRQCPASRPRSWAPTAHVLKSNWALPGAKSLVRRPPTHDVREGSRIESNREAENGGAGARGGGAIRAGDHTGLKAVRYARRRHTPRAVQSRLGTCAQHGPPTLSVHAAGGNRRADGWGWGGAAAGGRAEGKGGCQSVQRPLSSRWGRLT